MNIQMENVANSYVEVITALNKELNNAIYWANTYERSLSMANEKIDKIKEILVKESDIDSLKKQISEVLA